MKKLTTYFSRGELALWGGSAGLILVSFFLFDRVNFMTLAASLIFNAKGNPIGQALMVVFSLLYGVISYTFSYFGEMITYLGMTGPMALFALVSWLRNSYNGNHAEVAVNRLENEELALMYVLTAGVTFGFYFVLDHFDTANMLPSTLSVTTSFIAVYLTFRRSSYFALAYAANDVVLIVMWTMSAKEDISYVRCSTSEQNEARQLKMMEDQKVEKIFIDKASGKNIDRKDFTAMMAFVRAGDTVIVESISRIARNTRDLLTIIFCRNAILQYSCRRKTLGMLPSRM